MSETLFEKNLAVFRKKRPNLATLVDEAPALSEGIVIEPSKTGPVTAKYTGEKGVVYLHSRYDPWKDARRLVDKYDITELTTWVVLGCGLGYHLLELFDRTSVESIIVLVEPDLSLFREALHHHDWTKILESNRVVPLLGRDVSFYNALRPYIGTMLSNPVQLVGHAASLQREKVYFDKVRLEIQEVFVKTGMVSVITALSLPYISFENRMENLVHYVHSAGLDSLSGLFEGYPGIVVSAGPSLYRNYHLLEKFKNKAVIVAVSTMLKPMLDRGPVPDFSAVVDYHKISKRYFEGIDDSKDVVVLASPRVGYTAIDAYSGPMVFTYDDYCRILLNGMEQDKTFMDTGSTVAHAAFRLVQHLGCDPIIFVGQDLGFPDGLSHVPGTAIYTQWHAQLNRFNTYEMREWEHLARIRERMFKIKDVNGRQIYTDSQMFGYLREFERMFDSATQEIIDATEGGARMEGTRIMTLADAAEQYCAKEIPVVLREKLREVTQKQPMTKASIQIVKKELEARRKELCGLEKICAQAKKYLEKIAKRHEKDGPADDLVSKAQKLRADIKEYDHIYGMLSYIMPGDELTKTKQDRTIDAKKLSGLERQKAQAERDATFVRAILGQAKEMHKLLDRGERKLELVRRALDEEGLT